MKFRCNGRAPEIAIASADATLRGALPQDYLDFARQCNGGEGFVGNEYLVLWSIEELESFNREYEVSENLGDIVLFGSNGGGEAFGFRRVETHTDIVRVPFIGMSPEVCIKVASSFAEFIQALQF